MTPSQSALWQGTDLGNGWKMKISWGGKKAVTLWHIHPKTGKRREIIVPIDFETSAPITEEEFDDLATHALLSIAECEGGLKAWDDCGPMIAADWLEENGYRVEPLRRVLAR